MFVYFFNTEKGDTFLETAGDFSENHKSLAQHSIFCIKDIGDIP